MLGYTDFRISNGMCFRGLGLPEKGHLGRSRFSQTVERGGGQTISWRKSVNDFRENSIRGPQHIDIKTYRLRITGLINNRRTYTYSDLINKFQHHRKVIRLDCVEGWSATILWEGLLVRDLLKEAVLSPKAKVVIFHASDGYTTSFPVDYLLNNDIMIAYRMNDVALPPSQGFPFRLVAESKWGYKWIRWITDIEVSDKSGYKGYWESRGYSNSGDLNKSFFDERAQ
jgi:DMSO/TMAO reductase YedYZ molybdopterin-dependent catalytic subunit